MAGFVSRSKRKVVLVIYDILILLMTTALLLFMYKSGTSKLPDSMRLIHTVLFGVSVFSVRIIAGVYRQVWRYGGIKSYIVMLLSDGLAFWVYFLLQLVLIPDIHSRMAFDRALSMSCINLLGALAMRMVYRYCYKCSNSETGVGRFLYAMLKLFAGEDRAGDIPSTKKTRIAILGAGRVGVALAEELAGNPRSNYIPACFIDIDSEKVGRNAMGIKVIAEEQATIERLKEMNVQELVFAVPQMDHETKKKLYEHYAACGFKIRTYDYPAMQGAEAGGKRRLREFDIEDLLFRKQITINGEQTRQYYTGKTILVTGGGGSIGSELCRQLAKFGPERIIILDVAENGAYDIQQELRLSWKDKLNLNVEICSICNRIGLERVFEQYHPDVVIMAAAHKHVPLMEKNCIEAVENNVFGTLNTVETAVKYGAERVIMVSTDKAVNPTNVMGATKRMCEMIVHSYSTRGYKTTFSITRFGNVLGSAGSVIPLFRRQIMKGGPVTLTDRRIIRYFMTIPEASQLVLESGAMAKNGELFVLDMGQPVKILDLAENMIKLSGFEPYADIDIIETGLRPGEKLYEELLIKSETLGKTSNNLIFTEVDEALSAEVISERLDKLADACRGNDDIAVRVTLKQVVPTYHAPEEVNKGVK